MTKLIYIPIYGVNVVFCWELDKDEWIKFCKRWKTKIKEDEKNEILSDINNECVDGSTLRLEIGDYIVYVKKMLHGNIAHEIYHTCNFILMARGVEHSESDEAYAYLVGYLTDEVYKAIETQQTKGSA